MRQSNHAVCTLPRYFSGGGNWFFTRLLVLGIVLSSPVLFAQSPENLQIEFYPGRGPHINPVKLSFVGERYENGKAIPAAGLKTDSAVDFFSRAISVNRDGPLEEILKLWDSKDRNDVRKTASDPAVFEANRQFFRSITSSRLLAKIDYGAYAIFFIAHSIPSDQAFVKEYPVLRMNGSFFMTNALQDDPVFIYLSAKYSEVLRESIVGKRSTVQLRRSLVLWISEDLESESALIEAAETIT